MAQENFEGMLTGGHPNSLGRTIEVVDFVRADAERLDDLNHLLDLEKYPIDRPDSAGYSDLIEQCQQTLNQEGLFSLHGLLQPQAAKAIVNELLPRIEQEAFHHSRHHNIYFQPEITDLPAHHPALAEMETSNRTLCSDQMVDSPLQAIYHWQPLIDFLAKVMNKPQLFTMPDPLAALNVMTYRDGEGLSWHFDRAEFTTTLLLQTPDQGGVFEYRKDLRSLHDPNYDGVAQLMRGEDGKVQQLVLSPGTLNIFRGVNTAHRVTPVSGNKERMIAVFSYFEQPNVRFSKEEQLGFYGRSAYE